MQCTSPSWLCVAFHSFIVFAVLSIITLLAVVYSFSPPLSTSKMSICLCRTFMSSKVGALMPFIMVVFPLCFVKELSSSHKPIKVTKSFLKYRALQELHKLQLIKHVHLSLCPIPIIDTVTMCHFSGDTSQPTYMLIMGSALLCVIITSGCWFLHSAGWASVK